METLCLVGNGNSGKTTLYNILTKSCEHTANFSGVTIDAKEKIIVHNGINIKVVDLAGVYSLNAFSEEEKTTVNYLFKNSGYILLVCEDTKIKRTLNLLLELAEMNVKIALLINIKTFCDKKLEKIAKKLEKTFKITVFLKNFKKDHSFNDVFDFSLYKRCIELPYQNKYQINATKNVNAIKICEKNLDYINQCCNNYDVQKVDETLKKSGLNLDTLLKDRADTITRLKIENNRSELKFDKILLGKFAIPIFICVMLVVFYLTFSSLGAFFRDLVNVFVQDLLKGWLNLLFDSYYISPIFASFVNSVLIDGVCSLFSFLPQIIILHIFITILEDSGYLPRLAFLFSDLLSKIGLNGKSLFPFLLSLGCSTMAMDIAKNQDNKKLKNKTMVLTQYICCSAKLPIFVMICSSFFKSNILIILSVYLIDIFVGVLVSKLFCNSKSSGEFQCFEMPKLSGVDIKKLCKISIQKGVIFVKKITGVVILFLSLVWFLKSFNFKLVFTEKIEHSILYTISNFLSPIFSPIGLGRWEIVCALIFGLCAKELIVPILSMLVSTTNGVTFLNNTLNIVLFDNVFTQQSALSFIVFVSLYLPCISSMSFMKKELGTKNFILSITLQFVLSYILSLITFYFASVFNTTFGAFLLILVFEVMALFLLPQSRGCDCKFNCWNCGAKCHKNKNDFTTKKSCN